MPWSIRQNFGTCDGFAVVKDDDNEIEGCHSTRSEAQAQLAALNASENETRSIKGRLGDFLSRRRDELELTTADLAEAAGVAESTMTSILSGEIARPPDARLRRLAQLLDVSFERLRGLLPSGRQEPEEVTQGTSPRSYVKHLRSDDKVDVYGGHGVVFGGQDLEGDTFDPDTDYMLKSIGKPPYFLDHTLDQMMEIDGKMYQLKGIKDQVGEVIVIEPDDFGLYMEFQVEKANRYSKLVNEMVNTGKKGLSTGSPGHLVIRENGHIRRWMISELSGTLTPAEPRTRGVERLKQLQQLINEHPNLKAAILEASNATDNATVDDSALHTDARQKKKPKTIEVLTMAETDTALDGRVSAIESKIDKLDELMNKFDNSITTITKALMETPKAKGKTIAPDSEGKQHSDIKSFSDFLVAIYRKNYSRLANVYKSFEVKDQTEGTGTAGGFLVPEAFSEALLQVDAQMQPLRSRVTTIPVTVDQGRFPVLDQFINPTTQGSGQVPAAAGIVTTTTAEGATLTETDATFEQLTWSINKIGGFTQASMELMEDSPISVEALLANLFRIAIGAKNERNIVRGSGVGEPQGIINAGCTVTVNVATDNTFAYPDALNMLTRFKNVTGSQPVWIIHPSVWQEIGVFETSAGGGVWQANFQSPLGVGLLGFPIVVSEHLAALVSGTGGDRVLLADLGAYYFFQRSQLTIAFSEHFAFTSQLGTWTFHQRNDGKPFLRSSIRLAGPDDVAGTNVSPFVLLND